jgi:hypothetical protein
LVAQGVDNGFGDFPAAFARALAAERTALIHLVSDPHAVMLGGLLA